MLLEGVHVYERFIARQPIFDQRMKVFAYELLFRGGPQKVSQSWKAASNSVIVDSTMLFDLQRLTGNAQAFINADQAALLTGAVKILPADRIVVEILETVVPTPEIVAACADLRSHGSVLALDDFIDRPKWEPLLPLPRYLEVDFRASDQDARRDRAKKCLAQGLELLGEKVEVILKQEPSLVYKLLRYLNSPILGLRTEVRSISHAISLLGEKDFSRGVSIVCIVSMTGDKPPEPIRVALTHAYFCEGIAEFIGMSSQPSDLFLMGLLSVIEALLDLPTKEVVSYLPLSTEVQAALCRHANRLRDVCDILLSYERANWNQLSSLAVKLGCQETCVPEHYLLPAKQAAIASV